MNDEIRPVPDWFMPEFTTDLDINGNEIRSAIIDFPAVPGQCATRAALGYVLSTPETRNPGRHRQPEMDARTREMLWHRIEARRLFAAEDDGA